MPRCARRSPGSARRASSSTTCGCAASRSARKWSSFSNAHQLNFIVEQNRDAQLRALLTLETGVAKSRMRSILHYNGMPLAANYVIAGVMAEVQDYSRPAAQLVRK